MARPMSPTSPIRVLRVIYDLQVGGVQRMLLRSIPLLRESGVELEVCCLKEEGELAPVFREAGVPVHLVPFRTRLDPLGLLGLRRLIRAGRFNLAHSQMYASNVALNVATLLGTGVPAINSYHSQTPFSGRGQERMSRWTRGIPARVIAVSRSVEEPLLKAGIPAEKLAVVYNGVEVAPEPAPLPDLQPGEPLRAFWAGRFVKQKRVEMLIDVAIACRRVGVPLALTLVGEGPLFEKMKRRVEQEGIGASVRFVGWQADIRPSIRESEVYLSASDREGFPNTLLEVCAQGRPFLVSDIAPNAEVLGGTEAGKLLKDDLEEWVNWIRVLQGDRSWVARMGKAAWERAHEFSVRRTVEEMVKIYREVGRTH
jgi:glycosyltransferase involved in cell wall biosynthesis